MAVATEDHLVGVQILSANMSALGLSQKPIYVHSAFKTPDRSGNAVTLETIPDAVLFVLTEPSIEDQLAWHTLWPESHKLYGHGNEHEVVIRRGSLLHHLVRHKRHQ